MHDTRLLRFDPVNLQQQDLQRLREEAPIKLLTVEGCSKDQQTITTLLREVPTCFLLIEEGRI